MAASRVASTVVAWAVSRAAMSAASSVPWWVGQMAAQWVEPTAAQTAVSWAAKMAALRDAQTVVTMVDVKAAPMVEPLVVTMAVTLVGATVVWSVGT